MLRHSGTWFTFFLLMQNLNCPITSGFINWFISLGWLRSQLAVRNHRGALESFSDFSCGSCFMLGRARRWIELHGNRSLLAVLLSRQGANTASPVTRRKKRSVFNLRILWLHVLAQLLRKGVPDPLPESLFTNDNDRGCFGFDKDRALFFRWNY